MFCHVEPLCMLMKVTWHLDGTMYNSYVHHFLNLFPALEVENGGGCVYLICSEMLLQIHFTYCIVLLQMHFTYCIVVPNIHLFQTHFTHCMVFQIHTLKMLQLENCCIKHICMFVNAVFPDTLSYSHGG